MTHFSERCDTLQGETFHTVGEHLFTFDEGDSSSSQSINCHSRQHAAEKHKILRKIYYLAQPAMTPENATDPDLLDDGILLNRDDENRIEPPSEQYKTHGVQIENTCFDLNTENIF